MDAARRAQEEADAAFARSLQNEFDGGSGISGGGVPSHPAPPPQHDQTQSRFTIRSGERAPVRLHHPSTRNHIGEVFFAHYVTTTEIKFELVNSPGKHLRVKDDGTVDFSDVTDATTRFRFEVTPEGPLYIMCSAHQDKLNNTGERSWYLALNRDGTLAGDSSRCALSQWVLVAADDVPPSVSQAAQPPTNSQFPYARQPPPPPATAAASSSGPGTGFAGLLGFSGGGREYNAVPTSTDEENMNPLLASPTEASPPLAATAAAARPPMQQAWQAPPPPSYHQPSRAGSSSSSSSSSSSGSGSGSSSAAKSILCQDPDEQLLWLSTGAGQSFLSSLPSRDAENLLAAGSLRSLLYRPDWPYACGALAADLSAERPSFNKAAALAACPLASQKTFFENGFVALRGVVPLELIAKVGRLASSWLGGGSTRPVNYGPVSGTGVRVELQGAVCKDCEVLSLYYRTALKDVAQLLIGEGEVTAPLGGASIQVFYPSLEPPEAKRPKPPSEEGTEWIIDGFTDLGGHSPYSLLIGVPLTAMTEPFSGSVCPHASSHVFLQEAVKQQIVASSSTFSQPGSIGKPPLPPAPPLLLAKGDAFLCTQKCALTYQSNCGDDTAKLVFFRVSQVDHDAGMKDMALDFLWCEFRGVEVLEKSEGEGEATSSSMASSSMASSSSSTSSSSTSSSSSLGGGGLIDFLNTPTSHPPAIGEVAHQLRRL